MRVEDPDKTVTDRPRSLLGVLVSRPVLLHLWVPFLFAILYTFATDMPDTAVHFAAAALTAALVISSYTAPARSVSRHGLLRGLLLASLSGSVVGASLGLLGTGLPPRGSAEASAFGSWLLVGSTAPVFGFLMVRGTRLLLRLPGTALRKLRSIRRPTTTNATSGPSAGTTRKPPEKSSGRPSGKTSRRS